jgi:Ser/Thr protein kinase RdoA (MazF antagonist)
MTQSASAFAQTSQVQHPLVTAQVLQAYQLPANTEILPFGNGHINQTFLLKAADRQLILQQINTAIFPSPVDLVQNALKIEQHLLSKQQQGLYPLEILRQQAKADGSYLAGQAQDLRALQFIHNGSSIEVVEKPQQAFAAALTFGQFAAALADFDAKSLVTVLPDFHNLGMRFSQLKQAVTNNAAGRLKDSQELVDFCLAQQHLVAELEQLCQDLPLRVCHNDTKINNMLYSVSEQRGIAAIDLDTCMPGFWLFDFGDMVRTCCSPEPEDSLNTAAVRVRPEIFKALAQGYLTGLAGVISNAEQQSLLLGAKVMCLMIGIRFLTDHLNGDVYFAVKRDNHNLQRAHNQIRLYQDLLQQQTELAAYLR